MTTSLQKAFEKASDLPESLQEELAQQLLEDIEGELKWDQTLASPKSQTVLNALADKARNAKRQGKTHDKGFDAL